MHGSSTMFLTLFSGFLLFPGKMLYLPKCYVLSAKYVTDYFLRNHNHICLVFYIASTKIFCRRQMQVCKPFSTLFWCDDDVPMRIYEMNIMWSKKGSLSIREAAIYLNVLFIKNCFLLCSLAILIAQFCAIKAISQKFLQALFDAGWGFRKWRHQFNGTLWQYASISSTNHF